MEAYYCKGCENVYSEKKINEMTYDTIYYESTITEIGDVERSNSFFCQACGEWKEYKTNNKGEIIKLTNNNGLSKVKVYKSNK
ncbi:MAG: hypothetical protein ACQEQF_07060 [Bacillota bacterium]